MSYCADSPTIKCFTHHNLFYFYDTYSNRVYEVSKKHFVELQKIQEIGISKYKSIVSSSPCKEHRDIITLINKGLLKPPQINKIEHPETGFMKYFIERSINDLCLQVTQNCNFTCRYCAYANDSSFERSHQVREMDQSLAKKAVDFLYEHSADAQNVTISFYGGEPLLNYKLIQYVVNYANSIFFTKRIQYRMTINASILTDKMLAFFVEHDFLLAISIDGPANIQNFHRKFKVNGEETFSVVYSNLYKIKNNYPDYFKSNVSVLPVLFEDDPHEQIVEFFLDMGIEEKAISLQYANLSGIDYIASAQKRENTYNYSFHAIEEKFIHMINNTYYIPQVWHHNGPCLPGIRRVFVDVNGLFYPCEKVVESKELSIGNIDDGLNLNKILSFLNIGHLSEADCKSCWAIHFCDLCVKSCYDIEKNIVCAEKKKTACVGQREKALLILKQYISKNTTKGMVL